MRMPSRRTFWASAAILFVVIVASFFMPRVRITLESFDRIQSGMTEADVCAILGAEASGDHDDADKGLAARRCWCDGPNFIIVGFNYDKMYKKELHVATAPETLKWYAKNAWWKIKRIAN